MSTLQKSLKLKLSPLAVGSIFLMLSTATSAENLLQLYDAARTYDATYLAARLQFDANLAKADQAKANLLPTVGLSANASRSNFENNNPVVSRDISTQSSTVSASQPIYRPGNWASYEQGNQQLAVARALLDAAEQDLIVRTSQTYFDVLAAQDSLTFVKAQKNAVQEQLAFAKRNFEVGSATITDTREAQARYDLVLAQEIAAENDLQVKTIALDQLVGKTNTPVQPLKKPTALPPIVPGELAVWLDLAKERSPNIRLALANLEVAQLEVDKAKAGHKPTLDLVASYNVTRNPNGTTQSPLTSRTTNNNLGVSLNVPLFAGFATQNRVRETVALAEKARTDFEGAQRSVAQSTRIAFLGVVSGQSQVRALEAAEASTQSALDANRLGYKVGVRVNIDVLNAQSQLFQTKRDLSKARYDFLVGGLKLRQASGSLTADDILPINALLAPLAQAQP